MYINMVAQISLKLQLHIKLWMRTSMQILSDLLDGLYPSDAQWIMM